MAPKRSLSYVSKRKPSTIQDIFIGIACRFSDGDMEYSAVLHDGTGVTDSETFHHPFDVEGKSEEERTKAVKGFSNEVINLIRRIQTEKSVNARVVAIAEPVPEQLQDVDGVEFFATVWLHVDAIPFVINPSTSIFTKLPAPSTPASATAAVSEAIKHLHPATHSATVAETDPKDHRVKVDGDGEIRLCSILQYQQSTSPELWKRFLALSKHLKQKKTSIAFFSATPQGGGVALMRHALLRLWKMVDLDVKWYVPEGHPTVFDITKRKFHNVLQGVAEDGVELSDEDKKWFELWTDQNYESFWSKGAIEADLIVIDDPQLTALIPIIKKQRPDAKIIFRSHIQIQSDLTDDESTPQYRTWNYLFNFIKDVDLFLAHPVKFFVPKNVHDNLPVLYMAPSTDPLDGLNKPFGHASLRYYRQDFNRLSQQQCGTTIDFERTYICQVARFDPSKGIPDLLEAYLDFRKRLAKLDNPPEDGGPQLIIMGHGSVDDPDGTVIYEKAHDILNSDEYELVQGDVAIVRAPPSDGLLGCILQGAWVATQLSTREGFEVKVTEAINKRVPIIASDAGGIPLQVKEGMNGWVVPTGDTKAVADVLLDIYQGKKKVERPLPEDRKYKGSDNPNAVAQKFAGEDDQPMIRVKDDIGATSEDFWTVGNACKWMFLASRVLGLEKTGEDEELLSDMKIGEKLAGKQVDGENVWRMMIGKDLEDGEGALR